MDKTHELSVIARSTEVALNALTALKKSVSDLLDQDMDIISMPEQEMSSRQKSFLEHLIKINHPDSGERNIKLEQLNSGLSRQEADILIKQYV